MTEMEKMELLQQRQESFEMQLNVVERKVDYLESEIKSIKTTIEDEMRKNNKNLAEGHDGLSRRLWENTNHNGCLVGAMVQLNTLESKLSRMENELQRMSSHG